LSLNAEVYNIVFCWFICI